MNILKFVTKQISNHPFLVDRLKKLANKVSPETVVLLDYPINMKQRWNSECPHQKLYDIINEKRDLYKFNLQTFLLCADYLTNISIIQDIDNESSEPCWINGWMPALDGVALYGFIVTNKPKLFMEVGSGNSTKFARKAIIDHNLDTKIVSIDPNPRTEIDGICDEIVRFPVESIDLHVFDRLESNDILYIDNSHRVFMNSDVTTLFLDVLPRLKSGVIVEIHDITLPYDYPIEWIDRYYSEQYLLASYLLAKGEMFDIILPNAFISKDDSLKQILNPLWEKENMNKVEKHGCSFWIRIK